MIVPSIDLMNGRAVQLIGGRELELDAGDPRPLAERFGVLGEIAVIDLDAALAQGDNAAAIDKLLRIAHCRVGGGIRSYERAVHWLDAGAARIILGTAARPELLRDLPRERVIAALDASDGEVVVKGWRERTGRGIIERIDELREFVGGFLVTFVEREGRLGGTNLEAAERIIAAAGDARVTIAGGVTTAEEVAALDQMGADAQVGMALYKGTLDPADAFAAPLISDREDGLWPTVVADEHGRALGLAYSNAASLRAAIDERRGVYWSRSRRALWRKGVTSGATQQLLRVDADCDRDALRFIVRQSGLGFCHRGTYTCWGTDSGWPALMRRLADRAADAPTGSYTRRLLEDRELLRSKLLEEAAELAAAGTREQVVAETADVIYFALTALVRGQGTLAEVEAELARRALRVTRRPGDAKSFSRGRQP